MICLFLVLLQAPYYTDPIHPQQEWTRIQMEQRANVLEMEDWVPTVMLYTDLGVLNCLTKPLEVLVKTFPESPGFAEALMIAYATEGRLEAALEVGEQALERFPSHPTLHFNLALVESINGRIASAMNRLITAMEYGLASKPQHWHYKRQWLRKLHRDPTVVLQILQKKSEANPESKALKELVAIQLVRLGRLSQAAALMKAYPESFENEDFHKFIERLDRY